jgi:hypothetical protein
MQYCDDPEQAAASAEGSFTCDGLLMLQSRQPGVVFHVIVDNRSITTEASSLVPCLYNLAGRPLVTSLYDLNRQPFITFLLQ